MHQECEKHAFGCGKPEIGWDYWLVYFLEQLIFA